jgi:hypothetical protein
MSDKNNVADVTGPVGTYRGHGNAPFERKALSKWSLVEIG